MTADTENLVLETLKRRVERARTCRIAYPAPAMKREPSLKNSSKRPVWNGSRR